MAEKGLPLVVILVLLCSPLFPFVASSEVAPPGGSGGHLVASGFEFFFMCLLDGFIFLAGIVSVLTGQGSSTDGFPFELINLAPAAGLLSVGVCVLAILGRKQPRVLGMLAIGALLTSFHSTFAMDMYYFDSFLPASWVWGGACIAAAG